MSKTKTGNGWPHDVRKKDLQITWYNGTGPGGQSRNKNANCCRMKHLPTGIMSQAQEHKSREQNLRAAFNRLAEQLVPIMRAEINKTILTKSTSDEVIRTYKEKNDLVIDNRIDDTFSMSEILDGKLDKIIDKI